MPSVAITEYTDPACPFAFSAEPHRLRLQWLFGDQLSFDVRMVGLAATREDYAAKGFTPERAAMGSKLLHDKWGMPMDEEVHEAIAATVPACRAYVAARLNAPEHADVLLRYLRVLHFSGGMLDDPALIAEAATHAGIDPDALSGWMAEEATETALAEDLALARDPSAAALALKQKLAETDAGWRYTCPSYEMVADGQFSAPGMQSSLTYETGLANVAPDLERRAEPSGVAEVLEWAAFPLASMEVAEVCGISREEARTQLAQAGAVEQTVGRDGFWSLPA